MSLDTASKPLHYPTNRAAPLVATPGRRSPRRFGQPNQCGRWIPAVVSGMPFAPTNLSVRPCLE